MESGVVRQAVNGEYVISFTALIEELKTEFLHDESNLIEYDNDYFRVISLEEEHNSDNMLKVSCECEHISYDLIKLTKPTYTQTDRAAIYVINDLLLNSGFNFIGTDVLTTASIDVQQETDIKSLLYQVAIIWGGELSYFQKDIELKQQLGSNRGADFRFGKNIQNIKRLIDRVENTVSYEIEIVQGTELQELGYFQLGDTIKVVDDLLGIELETRIVEVEKDLVTGLNSRVILGKPIKDLSTGFGNIFNTIKNYNIKVDKISIDYGNAIIAINGNIEALQSAIEDGVIVTYYQDVAPLAEELHIGDMWFCTGDINAFVVDNLLMTVDEMTQPVDYYGPNIYAGKLWRWNGSDWDLIEDKGITAAIEVAQNAQTTADGKIVSFYQDTIPDNGSIGDLWIDTNDGNKLYRHNGVNWVSARDGSLAKIDNVIDEHGNLIAEKLSGALNTAVTKVENSTSTVTFDDRGLITHDQPLESTSIKALLITSDGILIANARNTDGTWRWRTAITADGISADEINTGTLSAININGVTITGSTVTSTSPDTNVVLDQGTLQFKKNNDDSYIKFGYKAGLPNGVTLGDLNDFIEYNNGIPTDEKTLTIEGNNANIGFDLGSKQVAIRNDNGIIQIVGGKVHLSGNSYYDEGDYPSAHVNVHVNGVYLDLGGYGTFGTAQFNVYAAVKNAVINTPTYGDICYSAYEMSEVLLGDIGQNKVVDGRVEIPIPLVFRESVSMNNYHVFLSKYGKGDIWVSERYDNYFVVEGDDIEFSWEIKANRKDCTLHKFMPVDMSQLNEALIEETTKNKEKNMYQTIPTKENVKKDMQKELFKSMLKKNRK